jgi:hypothetical protein
MNVIQIMRRARQGVDAILPGGYASGQWTDEEVNDLVNEAYEGMLREFRITHKKWGLVTLNTSSASFTRDGETYDPATSLVLGSSSTLISLPPDFAELVRVLCTNNRSTRFQPAGIEMDHWIDIEQAGYDDNTQLPLAGDPAGLVFYYDILGNRTLKVTPPTFTNFNLAIDYIPMFRPLTYSKVGTVSITNGATAITGVSTTFVTDNVFSAASNQAAEIIIGTANEQSNIISVVRDYPTVASITSDTAATLNTAWGPASVSSVPFILAMVPVLPREYHRWLSRLTSSLMLSKVNPDTAEKYFGKFMTQFREQINPAIRRRTSQSSQIVEDADEFGVGLI